MAWSDRYIDLGMSSNFSTDFLLRENCNSASFLKAIAYDVNMSSKRLVSKVETAFLFSRVA